jgi:hypothetical protein
VRYGWGWESRPWYGYYGGYFRPYPVYNGPTFWLADFLIASTLEAAYLAQNNPGAYPPAGDQMAPMSPDVKEAVAEEVRRQMDQERADQAAGDRQLSAPPALFSDKGPRVFLVSSDVYAYSGNQECPLAQGDVLQLLRTPSPSSDTADVRLISSRGGGCPVGSILAVKTQDLLEMQNHMQETLDQGMAKLQSDQGRNGLPALPPQAVGTVNTSYSDDIRADATAQDELNKAIRDANQSEQEALSQSGLQPAAAAPAVSGGSVSLGMTFAQVENILGQPRNIADLGAKRIYLYKDLKVTFLNGRVTDVQ